MSFILDALRKSEHERQRAAMPGIAQVPFGAPRRQLPVWPMVVIAVLVVAVLALGGAWWRSASREPVASAAPPAPATDPVRSAVPLTLPPVTVTTPPRPAFSSPPPGARAADRSSSPAEEPARAEPSARAATPPSAPSTGAPAPSSAPVRQGSAAPQQPAEPAVAETTLPSAESLAAEGVAVPKLRLELHAYAPRPADRFVFINGTKYLEGATLAEGPRLASIAPNGAVMTYLGHRFLLTPQ